MKAFITRYDGRRIAADAARDALQYALDWTERFGPGGLVGVVDLFEMVTLGLATQKPDDTIIERPAPPVGPSPPAPPQAAAGPTAPARPDPVPKDAGQFQGLGQFERRA